MCDFASLARGMFIPLGGGSVIVSARIVAQARVAAKSLHSPVVAPQNGTTMTRYHTGSSPLAEAFAIEDHCLLVPTSVCLQCQTDVNR